MIFTAKNFFQYEKTILAPFAVFSSQSKGRKYPEPEDPFRTPFQRDRDRIIHSKAFRRLSGKTQVFVPGTGDHYRSRLTHSIEVAQVSRDIARPLRLNEDLCEAISLGHDLGHTPFGHAGEEAMDELMKKFGDRFEHNEQTLRVVDFLEKRSSEYHGLNLTMEVLEGLMKHRPIKHSLEAQVVDVSDMIAYVHHDLDDGLRSHILHHEDLKPFSWWKQAIENLSIDHGKEVFRRMAIGKLMSVLIADLLKTSQDGVRIRFSDQMQIQVEKLGEFLGQRFYLHEKVATASHHGKTVIRQLFELYFRNEHLLPFAVRNQLKTEKRHIVIKDYIAGMTDAFAQAKLLDFSTKFRMV